MAKINEIDVTSLTFQEGSAPTTPASTKWKLYSKTDGFYQIDDAGTETALGGAGGGGGTTDPDWMGHLASADDSPTAEDNFDNATIGTTQITTTGTVAWTEKRDLLSGSSSGTSGADLDMQVYALPGGASSAPVTIETRAHLFAPGGTNAPRVFLGFTDGTTSAANISGVSYTQTQQNFSYGTVTAVSDTLIGAALYRGWVYLRVVWVSANTFQVQMSPDGVTFSHLGNSSIARTITPTHYGVGISSFGHGEAIIGSFEYLRVYASDLSVTI